jgi:hypothetical protein
MMIIIVLFVELSILQMIMNLSACGIVVRTIEREVLYLNNKRTTCHITIDVIRRLPILLKLGRALSQQKPLHVEIICQGEP